MTTWTKQKLAETVNQRVDRMALGNDYIMANDITDAALKQFQEKWDVLTEVTPAYREMEITKLYKSIVAGWQNV